LVGGSATAARSSGRATGKGFDIDTRFRIDFVGTNTVHWTLTPGASCSASGSGSQQIRMTSAGRAAGRTIRLWLSVVRGRAGVGAFSVGGDPDGGPTFRVSQQDDREASITDSVSADCEGLPGSSDFVLGGPGSLCGITKSLGPQRIEFPANVWSSTPPVRKGGLELGFDGGALGAPWDGSGLNGVGDEVYYSDPSGQAPDCPVAGDTWLNYFAKGHAVSSYGANDFLLTRHNSTDGVVPIASYAPFSLKKLGSCRAKTITAHTFARRTSSGPFSWSDGDPDGAHWSATTTLRWKMTLHRVGRCVKKSRPS
jgi:hypothetical protein